MEYTEALNQMERIIFKEARSRAGAGVESYEDYVQLGRIAVWEAMQSYSPTHESGATFITFATTFVRAKMNAQIAHARRQKRDARGNVSLEDSNDDGGLPLSDTLASEDDSPEEEVMAADLKLRWRKALESACGGDLTLQIIAKYRLLGDPASVKTVADILRMSKESVGVQQRKLAQRAVRYFKLPNEAPRTWEKHNRTTVEMKRREVEKRGGLTYKKRLERFLGGNGTK